MRLAYFTHSIRSCWNHGNAHFIRGLLFELRARGHEIQIFEPRRSWSCEHLVASEGCAPLERFATIYPGLAPILYDEDGPDLPAVLADADLVVVHEWTDPALVARIGQARRFSRWKLLFHDTHHRAVSEPEAIAAFDLAHYDAVLAFGRVLRDRYLARRWCRRAYTFHEAADPRVFRPFDADKTGDLVWIGNWGDGERDRELRELLVEPVRALGLRATVHGVRYPEETRLALRAAGLDYRGFCANFDVPFVFARHRVTVHVPRRFYANLLPGIPTIRPFEALACGIPLVSAPWRDDEGLFQPGKDYLVAADGADMTRKLRAVLAEPGLAAELAAHGRATILSRHTVAHRADQLLAIAADVDAPSLGMEAF